MWPSELSQDELRCLGLCISALFSHQTTVERIVTLGVRQLSVVEESPEMADSGRCLLTAFPGAGTTESSTFSTFTGTLVSSITPPKAHLLLGAPRLTFKSFLLTFSKLHSISLSPFWLTL